MAFFGSTLPENHGGSNQNTYTSGDLIYASAANTLSKLGIGSSGQVLKVVSGFPAWGTASTGTVTSVGLSLPAELTVSNSPVTTTGTLTAVWANESANRVFAGPATGSPTTPTFRALVAADLPGTTYNALSADTTLTTAYQFVAGDATSASITLTLPGVSGNTGVRMAFKKVDSSIHTVTVKGSGSELIDAANTFVITNQYDVIQVFCNGTSWYIF